MRYRRRHVTAVDIIDNELGLDMRRQVLGYAEEILAYPSLAGEEMILEFIESTLSSKYFTKWKNFLCENVIDEKGSKYSSARLDANGYGLFELDADNSLKIKKTDALIYLKKLISENSLDCRSKDGFAEELLRLQDSFGLDDDSIEVIIFLFCREHYSTLDQLFSRLNMGGMISLVSKFTGVRMNNVSAVLSGKGSLAMSGLIENNFSRDNRGNLEINPVISEYFFGLSDDFFDDRFIVADEKPIFSLESFHQNQKNNDTIQGLLQDDSSSAVLLYGVPGTGKTEYARTIAALSNRTVFFLKYEDSIGRGRGNYQLALQVASKLASMQNGILIVDEAEILFGKSEPVFSFFSSGANEAEKTKSWVNNFMDDLSCATIWILNSVNSVHESTMRRFSYSVKFNEFDNQQRIALWNECLKTSTFKDAISQDLIEKLAYEFPTNAGGIDMSLQGSENIFSKKKYSVESLEIVLRNFLEKQLLLNGKKRGNPLKRITENYDLSVLNLDVEVDELLNSLQGFSDFLEEGDQFARHSFKMLFWGKPGTGKTEFAKYLAKKINRELIVKRASDLISMWVGGTEKNIAAAFRLAEDKNAVLFIDEIDTFLASRESANRSYEVNQVNEFLTQLENFRGIFVGCSNLLEKLDFASLRRFDWKVEFKELTKAGREILFKNFFKKNLNPEQKKDLEIIKGLVPGDFNVVKKRSFFTKKNKLVTSKLLHDLAKEAGYREKGKVDIGFS